MNGEEQWVSLLLFATDQKEQSESVKRKFSEEACVIDNFNFDMESYVISPRVWLGQSEFAGTAVVPWWPAGSWASDGTYVGEEAGIIDHFFWGAVGGATSTNGGAWSATEDRSEGSLEGALRCMTTAANAEGGASVDRGASGATRSDDEVIGEQRRRKTCMWSCLGQEAAFRLNPCDGTCRRI